MATETPATAAAAPLPAYIRAATPIPLSSRAPWYKNTAPTYAGIFLWFVFWDSMPSNGLGMGGLIPTLVGVVIAGLICHFLFYLVPGLFGMKTGLPLYIVGTSSFGAVGGLLMPGFLMGLLQFGWLAVNTYFSSKYLIGNDRSAGFYVLCIAWAAAATFVGLKGIQYVAKVATFLPLIPLAVLILALVKFAGLAGAYKPIVAATAGHAPLDAACLMVANIVGFFATAGAAGVDFGMNNRDQRDVQLGGIVGILIAIVFTAGAATIAVAGAHVQGRLEGTGQAAFTLTNGLQMVLSSAWYKAIMIGLTVAAFPGACFSSFIAANSFKTVMPRVNSFVSVGIGALVAMVLAASRVAADLSGVFNIIGASFGPICGAMAADYLLAGGRWTGPRAGFNPAGWVAWLLGFIVGILPNFSAKVPVLLTAPVAAFLVGAIVYFIMALIGLQSPVLAPAPAREPQVA